MKVGNLLIVDDEIYILDIMRITLDDCAENIFTATNGGNALDILQKEEIHCVISDIKMPGMSGVQLLKEMQSRNINIPFIFYTGHGDIDLMKEAALLGAFDFLDKPNLNGLLSVIKMGLKEGFNRTRGKKENWESIETEYIRLLAKI